MNKQLIYSITKNDLKVDTFKSGGPGGQHQNKTDSGVRITHIKSGIYAESREHKSQIQNKKEAINRLADRMLFWIKKQIGIEERKKDRNTQSFGGKYIRTYNLYANRIVDHSTGITLNGPKKIKYVFDGNLDILHDRKIL